MIPPIERLSVALSERYRIEREIGQGGMATVYLAHDLKHDRQVALKVLKPELAAVLGADRFVQEIKTTAALQHPHILPLFDSGVADSFLYYVMPFIDGETLRSKLDRETQLGIDESVRIASNIADALDYAHRHGVIHRDIKPENILLHEGRPMVADFGIALAVSAAAGGRMTETGLSLGTPHYMSPEQATGEKEITARSDIYSLASVLYEMLTGNPPHVGASAQQIIMKIVTEEAAPVTKLRKSVPPNVAAAVAKGVEKLPADRFASAADFAAALGDAHFTTATANAAAMGPVAASRWRSRALIAAALATVFAAAALVGFLRPPALPMPPVLRYSMGLPPGQAMRQGILGINMAISPDGKRIAYVGPGGAGDQLWVRERDRLDATPLAGTTGGYSPYFSPDGNSIAFSAGQNVQLKVIPVTGGPPIMLASPGLGSGGGGAWGPDGWIYFDSPRGLMRVRADGGTPELLISLDTLKAEVGHAWPDALPNGKGILYRSRRNLDPTDFDIVALDFKTKERHVLTKGLIARFIEPGFLVYLRSDGAVLAAPFDQNRMKLTGPAVPLFEGVMTKPFGSADIAFSRSGTLVYVPGLGTASGGVAEVVYVSRAGAVTPLEPALNYNFSANRGLSLSPDGKMVAVDVVTTGPPEIWIKQLPAGPLSRLTFDGHGSFRPRWLPDGKSVVYVMRGDSGGQAAWTKRADGSAPAKMLWHEGVANIGEVALSSDGEWLVFRKFHNRSQDIFAVRPGRDTVAIPLLTAGFTEQGFALSPDNKWLAYTSDESGLDEVFVRPFPNTNDGRWQISNRGGTAPRWSRSGRELFFEGANGDFMVAPITPGSTFAPGEPRRLFSLASAGLFGSNVVPFYDVTPDGRDFLMVRISAVNQAPGAGQIVMVENWHQELMSRMKAKQ